MHIPSALQLMWQRQRFGLFCHFGINTFYGKEWSDGTLSAEGFLPRALDCRQWVRTAQAAGARYLILTAKHCDGFCLWQTETTRYSVASSPWQGGKGDVVGELGVGIVQAGEGRTQQAQVRDRLTQGLTPHFGDLAEKLRDMGLAGRRVALPHVEEERLSNAVTLYQLDLDESG